MISKPLERDIERKCCALAERHGWQHIKLDNAKRNWPDRLFLGPASQVVIVEFKRPGEKPRKAQAALHRRLAALGHQVHVLDSVAAFRDLLDRPAPPEPEQAVP